MIQSAQSAKSAVNLRSRIELLQKRPGFNLANLASHTNLAHSTLRNLMTATGGQRETPNVVRELTPVLDRLERGEIFLIGPAGNNAIAIQQEEPRPARVKKIGKHYSTDLYREVLSTLDYCWDNASLGCFAAPSQTGKSHGVRAWKQAHPKTDVTVIEFQEFSIGNKCDFMQRLGNALLGPNSPRGGTISAGKTFDAVVDHLRAEPGLLIFDQCEAVRVSVFQVIRQLWDAVESAGTGMCLFGTPLLWSKLQRSKAQALETLTRRICPWRVRGGISLGEMEQIVAHEGITDIDQPAMKKLWELIDGPYQGGCTGLLMHAVQLLKAKAEKGKTIGESTITKMAAFLAGIRIE